MATTRRFGFPRLKTLTFVTGLAVAAGLLSGFLVLGVNRTNAATCTDNDIIKCGFSTPSDFISRVRANNNGVNSTPDLQAIYAHYGLTAADYNNFAAHAVSGEAMRNGDIVVNGQTVATGGKSIGRLESFQGSNPFTVNIGGINYFGNVNSEAFAAGVNEIPVFVLFDASGAFKFAVMPSCGNPEFPTATVVKKGSAACQVLNSSAVSGKANTFNFTAAATTSGTATITKFVYNFGDGSPAVTETSGTTPVTHTYTSSGTFTASVTVFANLPGKPNTQLPAVTMCTKTIKVVPPPPKVVVAALCKQLTATPAVDNKMMFTFVAVSQASGARLTSADFSFGDGNSQADVPPNSGGTSATATHTYTSSGTFTASAVLHFTGPNGQASVTAQECTAVVSPVAPTPPAQPTPPTPAVVVSQPQPAVLPGTGAGDVIGLFAAVATTGFLGYQTVMRRKLTRR